MSARSVTTRIIDITQSHSRDRGSVQGPVVAIVSVVLMVLVVLILSVVGPMHWPFTKTSRRRACVADDCVLSPQAASKPPPPGDLRDHQETGSRIVRADPLGDFAARFSGARAKLRDRGPFLSEALRTSPLAFLSWWPSARPGGVHI